MLSYSNLKKLSFLLLFITFRSSGFCQPEAEKISPLTFKTVLFTMNDEESPIVQLPISGIKVHDVRPDTSFIGFERRTSGGAYLNFRNGSSERIQQYYSSAVRPDGAGGTLHCFLRKLIITNHVSVLMKGSEESPKNTSRTGRSGAMLIAEFYEQVGENLYIPLYRIDTLVSDFHRTGVMAGNYLQEALRISITKAGLLNWKRIREKASRLSIQQIDSFNISRLNISALENPQSKGVYFTYDDFKKNKPADIKYKFKKEKIGSSLYTENENGEYVEQPGIWGYCDGSYNYIHSANHFFKLHRRGNGYILFGAKYIYEGAASAYVQSPKPFQAMEPNYKPGDNRAYQYGWMHYSKPMITKELFQLDLDSGEIF